MSIRTRFSRRTFLCGSGVALSLPWCESLSAWGAELEADKPPVRYACVYFGNGVGNPEKSWWAKGAGDEMELSSTLQPLEPVKDQVFIPMGLLQAGHKGRENHVRKCPTYLSYGPVGVGEGRNPIVQTSIDQVMAQNVGHKTPIASMALGIEPVFSGTNKGISYTAAGNISWTSPTTALPKEIYPALAFDKLVDDGKGRELDKSVLDLVMEDARAVRARISSSDRQKLDEYLNSVRDVEKRIEQAGNDGRREGWRPPAYGKSMMQRPDNALPWELTEHMRLMYDILYLAFRTDRTRIATLMLNNEISNQRFNFLPGVSGSNLHAVSHNDKDSLQKINRFQTELFADFIGKLKNTPEGEGCLLDNCMIQYGCCMWTGGHSAPQLPVVIAGRGGGTIRSGQAVDYSQKEDKDLSRLYLSMMDRMGVRLDRFGPTTQRLPEFSV